MAALPIFPLGAVLLPGAPLQLRLFEPRYLQLLADLSDDEPEFGVVLIERGSEVGGGDARFGTGTVARVVRARRSPTGVELEAVGTRRFQVDAWLPDDPYPRADVAWLPELRADAAPSIDAAARAVADALVRGRGLPESFSLPPELLDADPVEVAWRLAQVAPIGPLDRLGLLRAGSLQELLDGIRRAADETTGLFD